MTRRIARSPPAARHGAGDDDPDASGASVSSGSRSSGTGVYSSPLSPSSSGGTYVCPGMISSVQPTLRRSGEYLEDSGSSDGWRARLQYAMERPSVRNCFAIDVSVSPDLTL